AGEAPRNGNAARTHADKRQIFDAFVSFDDFVGDSSEGAADAVRIHDSRRHGTSLRPRRTAVKESIGLYRIRVGAINHRRLDNQIRRDPRGTSLNSPITE